jgi:hypothetical protein
MSIDNDFAAIGKLDFKHASAGHLEIQIGIAGFKSSLDFLEHRVSERGKFAIIHPVLPFSIFGLPTNASTHHARRLAKHHDAVRLRHKGAAYANTKTGDTSRSSPRPQQQQS